MLMMGQPHGRREIAACRLRAVCAAPACEGGLFRVLGRSPLAGCCGKWRVPVSLRGWRSVVGGIVVLRHGHASASPLNFGPLAWAVTLERRYRCVNNVTMRRCLPTHPLRQPTSLPFALACAQFSLGLRPNSIALLWAACRNVMTWSGTMLFFVLTQNSSYHSEKSNQADLGAAAAPAWGRVLH